MDDNEKLTEKQKRLLVLIEEVMKKHMSIDTIVQVSNLNYLDYATIEYIDGLIEMFPGISEYELRKNISDMLGEYAKEKRKK